MENMSGMFSFTFWVIRALKCEAVNFPKFESADVPIRPFEYLDVPILIIACAPCTRVHDAHAQRDVTRFAYYANHVIMTSPAFAFHLCHVGMRWCDVIDVHIVGTPHHYGLHHMGMRHDIIVFSSCSHCIDDVITLDHDVIATCMNHNCSCGV